MPNFPTVSPPYYACLLALVAFTTLLQHSLKIWIYHGPASKSVFMTKLPGSSQTAVIVSEMSVCIYHSQTPFMNNVHEDCSYIKNQLKHEDCKTQVITWTCQSLQDWVCRQSAGNFHLQVRYLPAPRWDSPHLGRHTTATGQLSNPSSGRPGHQTARSPPDKTYTDSLL